MSAGRAPDQAPHSAASERAVLGSLLLDSSAFHRVADQIDEDSFYLQAHRIVFAAIGDVARRGRQPDPITVADELHLRQQLEQVGGGAFLSQLQLSVASALHLPSYVESLREYRARRQKLEIADLYARAAALPPGKAAAPNGAGDLLIRQARALDHALRAEQAGQDWQVFSAVDAFAERPQREDLVKGLIGYPSLNVVYGAPGTLKSFLLADLAVCLAAGAPWLAPRPQESRATGRPTVQVPTLWLDADNGRRCTHDRVRALIKGHRLDPAALPFYYVSMPQPPFDASDRESVEGLIRLARHMSVAAIFMDNLGVMSGRADENSAEMARVMANLRQVVEEAEAGVVAIHHQRKVTGTKVRVGETLRGHTSIEAALDLALLVLRDERAQRITVKCTKSRGPDVAPFGAVFASDLAPGTDELAAARFYGVPVEDDSPTARAEQAVRGALIAADDCLNKTELVSRAKAAAADVGVNAIRDIIDDLAAAGVLRTRPGPQNSQLYWLPSG